MGQQLAMDAFVVGLFDAEMAFAAGLSDVGMVDGRIAVDGTFDVMDAVAIVAGRRHDQAHLEQGAAVDAVEVLGRGLGMFDAVFPGQVGIVMTFGAGLRQVHLEDR